MAAQSFPPVLLIRPAVASARFASLLHDSMGPEIRILISPLMEPLFLTPPIPAEPFGALILTSETGAEAARRLSADGATLPHRAFCVGDRTAKAATDAGFLAHSAKGDAQALLRMIEATEPQTRFLHLHGRDTTGDIVQQLATIGIFAREAVVYDQRPRPLAPQAATMLAGDKALILPLFSPRSVGILAGTGPIAAPLRIAALSPAVAERAETLHPQRMVVAQRPDAEAMLQAIETLCVAGGRT